MCDMVVRNWGAISGPYSVRIFFLVFINIGGIIGIGSEQNTQ